jgi:hypothetical protein
MAEAMEARKAWVKKAVCDGLNLDGKYFDALCKHADGKKLREFLKEEPAASEAWLLFYTANEPINGPVEIEEAPAPAAAKATTESNPELEAELRQAAKDGHVEDYEFVAEDGSKSMLKGLRSILKLGVPVDAVDDKGYTAMVSAQLPSSCPVVCGWL